MNTRRLAVLLTLTALAAVAADKPSAEDVKKAEEKVKERLKDFKGVAIPKIEPVSDEAVARALPGQQFFAVRYALYPLAQRPAEGLKSQNLFAVNAKGEVKVLTDTKALEEYFRDARAAAKEEGAAKDAVLAWLRLVEEFSQDGYYQFKVVEEATKVSADKGGKKASARAVVMKGGNGEIGVELTFDADGKLTKATTAAALKPGARPKCHATKLLDPDPVVRAIVEQDLLIMGRAAKDYLDEQRAKASPELQKAIDRIWQRILEEDD
jgi:hypothetical protein